MVIYQTDCKRKSAAAGQTINTGTKRATNWHCIQIHTRQQFMSYNRIQCLFSLERKTCHATSLLRDKCAICISPPAKCWPSCQKFWCKTSPNSSSFLWKIQIDDIFFICRRLKKQTNPLGVNQEEQMQTLNQTQEHFVVVVERWGGCVWIKSQEIHPYINSEKIPKCRRGDVILC